jgi:hypothetical protein
MRKIYVLLAPVILLIIAGCSSGPNTSSDPRKVVLNMFRAIQDDDRGKLAHYLDFPALMTPTGRDYALNLDTARTFNSPEQVLDDLLPGGETYSHWNNLQKIVNRVISQSADTALVEVSFINKETSTQYYTIFGLDKINTRPQNG